MALARFDWAAAHLTFASVGNIEARVVGDPAPSHFIVRRGVIGLNAPKPVVTEHDWSMSNLMIMHSDGLKTSWRWDDFPDSVDRPANAIAETLLRALSRDDDDVTVMVIRGHTS